MSPQDKFTNIDKTLFYMSREDEEIQTKILAKKYELPYINLINYPILGDILYLIPEEEARGNSLVCYLKTAKQIKVATYNPSNIKQIDQYLKNLKNKLGTDIVVSVCSKSSFVYALSLYRVFQQQIDTKQKLEISEQEKTDYQKEIANLSDLKEQIGKVSISELLNVIFAGAVATQASDIHLEPADEYNLNIRYRIDGVLTSVAELPISALKTLSSRIKFLSKLKIDVHDKAQDGRFDATVSNTPFDIRVSIIPADYGESIVMRLLPRKKTFITLEELGYSPKHMEMINNAITKTHGIIFNTGPTGSGKTTTLYAVLTKLNKPGVKIMTLEDPIEYRIKGVDQSQVNVEKGYTFANGLRSLLRQDPDIMMVGEVRDTDTAKIAIQAAITGHLVLTTLHTNSAPAAIPRLLDMGVEPYLLAGSINLIIAQRLVRKLCQKCRGRKCAECNNTGFRGRIAIAEMFKPSPEIEQLIKQKATIAEFTDLAKKQGMKTIYEDGLEKVRQGITTQAEIERVCNA